MTDDELAQLEPFLASPERRLFSGELYKIIDKSGALIPFIPKPEQIEVITELLAGNWLVIIKARQLGLSTAIGIFVTDLILFRPNYQASLVEINAMLAARKLDRIVKTAVDNLPEWLLALVAVDKSNNSQLSLDMCETGKSTFFAGVNARGGTNQFLWISEWGPIQHEDPARSSAIRTGALPSAKQGTVAVETTWMGGKGGDLWELIEPVITGQSNDWKIKFFPWYLDPENVSEDSVFDEVAQKYFREIQPRLDAEGVTLTMQQKRWWAKERRAQGIFMARENPTFLDECWSAPVEGAIYAKEIARAQAEGRVVPMPIDGSNQVHTFWDLGSPANTVVWYAQVVGREIRIIDCDTGDKGTATQRVAMMLAKGYNYGKHYLPHDAAQTERSGEKLTGTLIKAGLPASSIVCVPRCHSVWVGINHALELFPALSFNEPKCREGLAALTAYHTKKTVAGVADEPVHDWSSHAADAFRYLAEAHYHGLLSFKHTTAEVRGRDGGRRLPMKQARVSAF